MERASGIRGPVHNNNGTTTRIEITLRKVYIVGDDRIQVGKKRVGICKENIQSKIGDRVKMTLDYICIYIYRRRTHGRSGNLKCSFSLVSQRQICIMDCGVHRREIIFITYVSGSHLEFNRP